MKQFFAIALLFGTCYCWQIEAQVIREATTPNVNNPYGEDYLRHSQLLRHPGNQHMLNPQFLGIVRNQPLIQRRNTISEEQAGQPVYNYNIYQPIPSYSSNSNRPTNEAELNQYAGGVPRPIIINQAIITTTPVPPVQINQNTNYPPPPQYQQNRLQSDVQPLRPTRPYDQNQSVIPPAIQNPNLNKFEFITYFSWRLFQHSKREINSESNIVISPLSVQLLLSLVEQASADTTKLQLQNVIGNTGPLDIGQAVDKVTFLRSKNKLKIGSAIFISHRLSLNVSFFEIAQNSLVQLIAVDFNDQARAKNTVDTWAAQATDNKITNIFSGSQQNADLILTNAVYFDGAWKYPFNQTSVYPFFRPGSRNKQITFLKQTATLFYGEKNYNGVTFSWVELPYINDEFSMLIMMPAGFKLDELVEIIDERYFTNFISQIELEEKRLVHLRLPKFEMKMKLPLKTILQNMGLVDAFTDRANIPYLTHDKVQINDAQQDVYLSVDEKGTTAAAVTSFSVITLSSSSYDPEEVNFDVNQPFLAVILHKQTRLPIFIAKIFDP